MIDEEKFVCKICGKRYLSPNLRDGCEQSHRYIYIKIRKDHLPILIQFLYNGDVSIIPESLMKDLLKYKNIKD